MLIFTDDVMSGPDVPLEVCIERHVKMPLGVSVYLTPADDNAPATPWIVLATLHHLSVYVCVCPFVYPILVCVSMLHHDISAYSCKINLPTFLPQFKAIWYMQCMGYYILEELKMIVYVGSNQTPCGSATCTSPSNTKLLQYCNLYTYCRCGLNNLPMSSYVEAINFLVGPLS